MYESYFSLRQRPFSAAPLVSRYVPVAGLEQARQTLSRCIERAEGPSLVIGPAGCGKTLLCYLLADEFQHRFQPVLLFSGHLATRRDLLQAILFELGLPYRGWEEGELRLALIDYLTRSPQCPQGVLLVVDEAHALSPRLLEELRMITNVVRGGQPRVRLVLVGGPALEERLANPKLESFSQRLAARCYLEPLDRAETLDYVRAQLHMAGGDAQQMFDSAALAAVYKASDGIPRLINQVCDHALLLAAQNQRRSVDASILEKAWANLQQLPSPWSDPIPGSDTAIAGTTIEFGDLDDDEPVTQEDADLLTTSVEETPHTHFEPTLVEVRVAETEAYAELGAHEEPTSQPWQALAEANEEEQPDVVAAGATEVELVFDDPASEPSEMFEINLSLTGLAAAPSQPQWHSTEYCDNPADAAGEMDQPSWLPEGETLNDPQIIEEIVVDRYATLDALKRQGKLPRTSSATSVAPSLTTHRGVAAAAERSLHLAEALVEQATAVDPSILVGPTNFQTLTSEVVAGGADADIWSSVDLLPPGSEATPEARETPLEGLTIHLDSLENHDLEDASACCMPMAVARVANEEPALIVIEDESSGLQTPAQPQATPVKKQEYRQLFARLRRS